MSNKINLTTRRGFPLMFKREINKDSTRTVFGCYPDTDIVEGDELVLPADNGIYTVLSVKRRDVKGNYPESVSKKNAHFEAICNYKPQK